MSAKESVSLGREIPATRRVILHDAAHMPNDYSSTPGGTIFSTTPGGTRIVYDRAFLLQCRNSPLTKSPPPNMAKIPGVTTPAEKGSPKVNGNPECKTVAEKPENPGDEPQFEMDI
ncbi:hypothetical protein LOTGIDRAFT_220154 [Lottia gigantea]|uniref:Eukaryotic translation initiation factor 4E binding protein 1 n=1 Tax=Lottia gigantea TaxID=225164 RepID=V4A2D5_LOTGI|nr:hypothetical protein LOTGIDRAFT_220154 [Lottia gigantea]ESO87446.1 hypothetical protein LOTGIDRAFT_220154 [Lottia gigantea]